MHLRTKCYDIEQNRVQTDENYAEIHCSLSAAATLNIFRKDYCHHTTLVKPSSYINHTSAFIPDNILSTAQYWCSARYVCHEVTEHVLCPLTWCSHAARINVVWLFFGEIETRLDASTYWNTRGFLVDLLKATIALQIRQLFVCYNVRGLELVCTWSLIRLSK